jgi:folate-binding protein YgfZ
MAAGTGVHAFFLNAKSGRIITDLNVIERGESTLLELEARLIPSVTAALEKYHFVEQVRIAPADYHQISLHGPKAAELLGELANQSVAELGSLASASITLYGATAIVWRDDPTGAPGYHLLIPCHALQAVWSNLIATPSAGTPGEGGGEGDFEHRASSGIRIHPHPNPLPEYRERGPAMRRIRPIGWAAFNAARIEAGRPLFGIDFDDTVLPAETGQMARAVSFTKGCYPGQEIVARMHARNAIARQLIGLKFADDALPIAGAPVMDDQSNTIGGITSSTISPMLSNTAIAIALLKRPHFNPGTVLNAPAEGALRRAVVTELPFLKGTAS